MDMAVVGESRISMAADPENLDRATGKIRGPSIEKLPSIKYHYTTYDEASFKRGLWRNSSVTDKRYTDPVQAGQDLGIPTPNKVIPIIDRGHFKPNSPPIVQPSNRYRGGGTDFTNPKWVPPKDILPAEPIGGGG
jgi:hypothetical protein